MTSDKKDHGICQYMTAPVAYREVWVLVVPYVDDMDLYSACLVCRNWWQLFSTCLWGNPASHFGNDSDAIYRCEPPSFLKSMVYSY